VKDELERLKKEVVVALALSRHLPGGTEETKKTLSQNSRIPGRGFSLGPLGYEAGVLTTRPLLSL
jgi:hypothetical protein